MSRAIGNTDSKDSHEPNPPKGLGKEKSRRPASQKPVQPRLSDGVVRSILTPKTVLPLFFGIGIIFAPIGGLLLYAKSRV